MRIWKQVTLAVFFAIVGIAFIACEGPEGPMGPAGSGTDAGERIIGTWIQAQGSYGYPETWVFNANGNFTQTDSYGTTTYKFAVTGTKLVIASDGDYYCNVYDIYLSPNGKTLILTRDSGSSFYVDVLTKQ